MVPTWGLTLLNFIPVGSLLVPFWLLFAPTKIIFQNSPLVFQNSLLGSLLAKFCLHFGSMKKDAKKEVGGGDHKIFWTPFWEVFSAQIDFGRRRYSS